MFVFNDAKVVSAAIIILAALLLVYIIFTIILVIRIARMEKNYSTFMKGSNGENLESAILSKFKEFDAQKRDEKHTENRLEETCKTLENAFQKIGIVKYDAFSEQGGKLSYSLCLLDDTDNGFIITSIHSREGCSSYIKEIIKGQSYVIMSEEERKALIMAQKGQKYTDLE